MSNLIQQANHMGERPLAIERDWSAGHEVIVIEGVRFSAQVFRTMAFPNEECLYAFRRREDDVIVMPVRNRVEAAQFFDETFGADPEFAWDEVKHLCPSPAPLSASQTSPQMEEHHLGGEDQSEGDDDGL